MVSAVILSKNEQKNIIRCLESLSWCNEIIIIDDFSTDETLEIAKKLGAKVYQRHLDDNFATQRNFGLEKVKGDWVFFVDADEKISAELAAEIKFQISNSKHQKVNGFYFKRRDKFLGKWLNHGETASIRLLRLARKNSGQWQGVIHEAWQVKGRTKILKNPILHERQITISDFLNRINQYSTIRAKELFEQGKKTDFFLIITFPLGKFIQNFFLRLGFLDGFPGFAMAFLMTLHSLLVRCKLYFLWQKKN